VESVVLVCAAYLAHQLGEPMKVSLDDLASLALVLAQPQLVLCRCAVMESELKQPLQQHAVCGGEGVVVVALVAQNYLAHLLREHPSMRYANYLC
jgi:hypothetical protein